jgi:hypothetical protein
MLVLRRVLVRLHERGQGVQRTTGAGVGASAAVPTVSPSAKERANSIHNSLRVRALILCKKSNLLKGFDQMGIMHIHIRGLSS